MKKAIFTILFALSAILFANAQVYDGITQPTRFRIWVPTTVSLHGSSTSVSPFIGYRQNITSWFNITPVVQYEINSETFVPQVWLNFSICDKLYFLSRSIYNTKANDYRHTLSATYKLPMGFMIDGTWENIYNGRKFLAGDRLQFVGGYAYRWFVVNAGYSCRYRKGMIANIRFKVTEYNWLQFKYDGGMDCFQLGCALQFNRL